MNPKNPRDRKTLKNFFSDGARPTAQHYADLIDSGVNWKDDGFDKSEEMGWRIASVGDTRALMSFYEGAGERKALWTLGLAQGAKEGTMAFTPIIGETSGGGVPRAGLSLSPEFRVGVGTSAPDYSLDVSGVVRMQGRLGAPGPLKTEEVLADHDWHDITPTLEGCHAFEIVAGVGAERGDGRYAMVHAIAMNAYNPRNPIFNLLFRRKRIRAQSAMFESFADRLQLRWKTVGDTRSTAALPRGSRAKKEQKFNRPYTLQIRTASDFGTGKKDTPGRKDYFIRAHVTRLWFDRYMEGSRNAAWTGDDSEGEDHAR